MTPFRLLGGLLLTSMALVAVAAPWLAPNPPDRQFRDYLYAPPMAVRLLDDDGRPRTPFVYGLRLTDRVTRRFVEDRSVRHALVWGREGRLFGLADPGQQPLLLLGADQLGRDIFSRVLHGARPSLGVALLAAVLALTVGAAWGAVAGAIGGLADDALMRIADFVLVLPALYVVIVLRSMTPLVLSSGQVFTLMVGVFAAVGWPYVARGVRAIVVSERQQPYTLAARAVGVGPGRLLVRYLAPATRGFLAVQAVLLVPGFIVAEATLSYVGLGFTDPTASWGVLLQDASNVRAIADFPWQLSPAVAIVTVVLGVNLLLAGRSDGGALGPLARRD